MRSVAALLVAIALAGVALPARAQTLTWDEALRRARTHAPGAVAAMQSVRAARAEAQAAGRWPRTNPVLRLAGDYELDTDPSSMVGAGIEQEFDIAGLAIARGRQAEAAVRAAGQGARVGMQDALRETAEAFVDLDLAQRSVAIWTDLAAMYDQLARASAATEAAGVTARQQTLLALIEQGSIAADLSQAQAHRARARATLAVLVGVAVPEGLAVASDDALPPPDARAPEALVDYALTHRSEIAAARAQLDEANRRGTAAALVPVPAPTVQVGMRRERAVTDPNELRPNAMGQIGLGGIDHRSITVFANVAIPLPLFDRNQAERARAEADAATARENLAIAERRVRAEVSAAFGARAAAWATYERWRALASALDEAQALARRGYDAGQVGIVETLVALERVARGRLALVRSRADYWRARVALARAVGELQ
jgi:cobalt-zinc-cadmium efflux system outer membrane protein